MSIMLKYKMGIYWKACWLVAAPFIIGFIFIFFCVTYAPLTYQDYVFSPVGEFLGWMMVVAALFPILVYMVFFLICRAEGTLLEVM